MDEIYLSDIHIPFHDPLTWRLVRQVVEHVKPKIIYLGGDIMDCYAISNFSKDPRRKLDFQSDLDTTAKMLDALQRDSPESTIYWQEGNHEFRLPRYLWDKAEELSSLRVLSIPELLDLRKRGIRWIPQGETMRIGDLYHIHGHELVSGGQHPAARTWTKAPRNTIMGHHHKFDLHFHRLGNGVMEGVWVNGCLCSLTPEYILFPQWTQGFQHVHYTRSGLFHVQQIPIFRERDTRRVCCMVEGQLYTVKE